MDRLAMGSNRTMIDLFAGAGGLSTGLESAGFTSLYANEYIPQFAVTYTANRPGTIVDTRDIRSVDPETVRMQLGLAKGDLDLVAGGPPCQGFSVNAPIRSVEDRRNHLFRDFLRFVDAFEPRAILIENVPGLVSFEGGATLDAILGSLRELGYAADVKILYAPHFGVPQTRWRTVIIGSRDHDATTVATAFPAPMHHAPARVNFTSSHRNRSLIASTSFVNLESHTTIADAIGDLPYLPNGGELPDGTPYLMPPQNEYQSRMRQGATVIFNHRVPKLGATNMERLSHIPPGGNWTDIPDRLLPAGMKRARRSDHTKRYGRGLPDGLSSTILTKCDPHWGAYFHYSQERTYSVREAARIQSFPDRYTFQGTISEQYAQVGNAVPPLMAESIGRGILEMIETSTSRDSVAV